jgi:hypothetical protein
MDEFVLCSEPSVLLSTIIPCHFVLKVKTSLMPSVLVNCTSYILQMLQDPVRHLLRPVKKCLNVLKSSLRSTFLLTFHPNVGHSFQESGQSASTHPDGPLLLVLAPTRELAIQIFHQCHTLRTLTGIRSTCLYGGVPKEQQVSVKHCCLMSGGIEEAAARILAMPMALDMA